MRETREALRGIVGLVKRFHGRLCHEFIAAHSDAEKEHVTRADH
jgi:hypothetical protein